MRIVNVVDLMIDRLIHGLPGARMAGTAIKLRLLVTLAAVADGYALTSRLHVSGPLAMVVVGLTIGNGGRRTGLIAATGSRT